MAVVTWRLNQWKVLAGLQKIQWRSLTGCDYDQILKFWHTLVSYIHKQYNIVFYFVFSSSFNFFETIHHLPIKESLSPYYMPKKICQQVWQHLEN